MYFYTDDKGNIVDTFVHRLMFKCDRCGNTAPFTNGMETYHLDYPTKDNRTFCSVICVKEIIRKEYSESTSRSN